MEGLKMTKKGVKYELNGDVSKLNSEHQYSLVVAQREASDMGGKVHLCRLYDNVMWSIFTVFPHGIKPMEGYYLCYVKLFKLDKHGYTNLQVAPLSYLGKEDVRFSPVWEYLRPMMSELAYGGKFNKVFSTIDLPTVTDSVERLIDKGRSFYIWLQNQMMEERDYTERIAKAWQEAFTKADFRAKYPLLSAKYATPEGNATHELKRRAEFLQRAFKTLGENIKICDEQEIFQKCEELLQERKAKKAAKKVAKKA